MAINEKDLDLEATEDEVIETNKEVANKEIIKEELEDVEDVEEVETAPTIKPKTAKKVKVVEELPEDMLREQSREKVNSPILREKIAYDLAPLITDWEINTVNKLTTTTNGQFIDLLVFGAANPGLAKNLTSFIFSPIENVFQMKLSNFRKFEEKFDANPTEKTIQEFFDEQDIKQDFKKIERYAEANTIEEKKNVINNFLYNLTEQQKQWFRDLKKMAVENQSNEGVYTLYLVPFFLKGKILGRLIYSPIIAHEIELKFTGETVTLTKRDVTFNLKLFLFLERQIGLLKPPYNLKFKGIKDLTEILKNNFFAKKSNEINATKLNYEKFKPKQVSLVPEDFPIKLSVVQNVVISNYKMRGSALQLNVLDLIDSGEINDVFNPVSESFTRIKEQISSILDKEMINLGSRPLNYEQRLSITNALQHNTVIHGPPGTGKSETIASIIANYINRGGNVLVSSEKAAAMEEVSKRLKALNILTLPVYKRIWNDIQENITLLEEHLHTGESAINMPDTLFETNFSAVSALMDSIEDVKNMLTKTIKKQNINDLIKSYHSIPPEIYKELLAKEIPQKIKRLENRSIYSKKTINDLIVAKEQAILAYNFLLNNLNKTHLDFLFETIWPNDTNRDLLLEEMAKIKSFNDEWTETSFNKWISFFTQMIQLKKISASYTELSSKAVRDFLNKVNQTEEDYKKVFKAIHVINNNGDEIPTLVEYKMIYEYRDYIQPIQMIDTWLLSLNKKNMQEILRVNINAFTQKYIENICNSSEENGFKLFEKYILKKYREYQTFPDEKKQEITKLFNAVRNKETRLSINSLVKHHFNALLWLFPVWILTPEQVASLTPLQKDIFDYGIFDEASQMLLEKSYPLIYRCKINVVAGDENQMRPSRGFKRRPTFDPEDLEQDYNYDRIDSLLGKAEMSNWKNNHFKNHYRATRDTQIAFVNQTIYNKNLNIVSKNVKPYKDLQVIDFQDVNINETNNVNETEVEATVRLLMSNYKTYKTILVIFPNAKSTEYFEKIIQDKKLCLELADPNYSISISKARKALPTPKPSPKKMTQKRTKELAKLVSTDEFPLKNTFEEIEKVITIAFNLNQDKLVNVAKEFQALKKEVEAAKTEDDKKVLIQIFLEKFVITQEIIDFYLNYNIEDSDLMSNGLEGGTKLFTEEDYQAVFKKIYPDDSNENEDISIKNIDNAQGCEADLVIIPFGVRPKAFASKGLRVNSQMVKKFSDVDGKNILNVMITRNKDKTIILKSFNSEHIEYINRDERPDFWVFKEYIKYLDDHKQKSDSFYQQEEIITEGENAWDPIWIDIINSIQKSFPPEFVEQLIFKKDFMLGNQSIDLAILNKKEQSIKLLLLKNQTLTPTKKVQKGFSNFSRNNVSENLFSSSLSEDRNKFIVENFKFLDKIEYLQARGYNVHQILDFSYRMNREFELRRIMEIIATPAVWRKRKG